VFIGDSEAGGVHLAEGDVHDFRLGVEVDAVGAALAADAGGLDAAEGVRRSRMFVRVDPHHAGLHGVRDAVAAL